MNLPPLNHDLPYPTSIHLRPYSRVSSPLSSTLESVNNNIANSNGLTKSLRTILSNLFIEPKTFKNDKNGIIYYLNVIINFITYIINKLISIIYVKNNDSNKINYSKKIQKPLLKTLLKKIFFKKILENKIIHKKTKLKSSKRINTAYIQKEIQNIKEKKTEKPDEYKIRKLKNFLDQEINLYINSEIKNINRIYNKKDIYEIQKYPKYEKINYLIELNNNLHTITIDFIKSENKNKKYAGNKKQLYLDAARRIIEKDIKFPYHTTIEEIHTTKEDLKKIELPSEKENLLKNTMIFKLDEIEKRANEKNQPHAN